MADPQGLIQFTGFRGNAQHIGGDVSLSHGITPDVFNIVIVPTGNVRADVGSVVISYGGIRVVFPDCSPLDSDLEFSRSGTEIRVQIQDRRWKWKFGNIAGRWNIRQADGEIQDGTKKTPQELAKMLLDEMNERNADVSLLPNDTQPEVEWDNIPPAEALADLCESLQTRIVLGLNNRVKLWPIGRGAALPGGAEMHASFGVDGEQRPDSIQVIGGETYFQTPIRLEAVGMDVDETIKPISELSYKPAEGWGGQQPEYFLGVNSTAKNGFAERQLALRTVYRWYRIKSTRFGTLNIPNYGALKSIKQILPLNDFQLQTVLMPIAGEAGRFRRKTEVKDVDVRGFFFPGGEDYVNTARDTLYNGEFTVDRERGIVNFEDPVYRYSDTKNIFPADLLLIASFPIMDDKTNLYIRQSHEVKLPGPRRNTGALAVRRPDLHREVYEEYPAARINVVDTQKAFDIEAAKQAKATANEFTRRESVIVKYAGIRPIEPDGAIQQVSFRVGGSQPSETRASRNQEHKRLLFPNHKQRRRREKERLREAREEMRDRRRPDPGAGRRAR